MGYLIWLGLWPDEDKGDRLRAWRHLTRLSRLGAVDIVAQADKNRARMNTTDMAERQAHLARLQETAADPVKARAFLLCSSMIEGLRRAEALA